MNRFRSKENSTKHFCLCHFLINNGQNLRFFEVFRWNIFLKKFVPFLALFCVHFELPYTCVPLTFAEIFPSEHIRTTFTPYGVHKSGHKMNRHKNRYRHYSLGRSFGSRRRLELWLPFFKKQVSPERKIIMGKFFRNRDFYSKMRLRSF